MEQINLTELLKKYKAGTLNNEETALLNKWYSKFAKESESTLDAQSLDDLFSEIHSELFLPKRKKIRRLWPYIAVASSILLIVCIGGYKWLNKLKISNIPSQQTVSTEPIKPGSNKATLTLADGRNISINDASTGTLAMQAGTTIQKGKDGRLNYVNSSKATKEYLVNKLTTPFAGEAEITLSDGTQVRLDAGSSITYPVAFNATVRRVEITGQAYFKVKHNEHKPFVVIVGGQKIEDIGTEFNVNAYKTIKTTLVEGLIKVNGHMLKPGQEAISWPNSITIQEADIEEATSWSRGYFKFNNENIQSIMDKISRWYDVEFNIDPGVVDVRFTGTISRYKNLDQVLYMLSYGQRIHFKVRGRQVTVMQ